MKSEKKYEASIVDAIGGTFVWRSRLTYDTHGKAVQAIVRKAKRMKMMTAGYIRGWRDGVYDLVDFGSYSYYGKIRRFA